MPERKPTILLVEDDPRIRCFVKTALVRQGYEVFDYCDPLHARSHANRELQGRLTALLTDVILPNMSGPKLAESLRERNFPTLPIIYMSGFSADTLPKMDWNREHFLQKPFQPNDLLSMVRKVCGHGHAAPEPPVRVVVPVTE